MDHSFVVNDKYDANFGTDSLILFSWWLNGKNDAWLTSKIALDMESYILQNCCNRLQEYAIPCNGS